MKRQRGLESGFTLIEILLVITLIALSIAMVAPSFVNLADGSADDEARRLQQMLRLAAEEAQLTGVPMRFTAMRDSYRMESLGSEQSWVALSGPPFNPRNLPEGVELLAVHLADGVVQREAGESSQDRDEQQLGRIALWPDGMVDAADIVLGSSDAQIVLQLRPGPGGIRLIEAVQ